MELVRGIPITEFCDQRRLTTRQRLELFVTVCHAVQHAHHKGIIHRDLKPSNVLVTLHDTVAVPKVIDFGIAKAASQPLTERTLFTGFGQMIGTPLYMSPEQAEMNGLDVDTRSDVYALGVLLYELLTGTTPFAGETLKKVGLDEMRRLIREEEPPTLSQRVCTLGAEAASTVSERRGVDGRRLGQVLRGELDWVVMKALEKDRSRRYESASAFAADVQRYLKDEAVEACPPSAGYRLRKFVRRNRRPLATAGVIAAALVAATAVSIWQAAQATEAQHQTEADRDRAQTAEIQAETDRDRAQSAEQQAKTDHQRAQAAERRAATEAAIAQAVNDFLQGDLLAQVDSPPDHGLEVGGVPYLTVREALDRASARIGERFKDQPLVEAAIRTTLGVTYHRLHDFEPAIRHLERAFALRTAHLDLDHPDRRATISQLANAYKWSGRHAKAIPLYQQLVDDAEARFGPDHADTLGVKKALAETLLFAGQLAKSATLWEELLQKCQARWGPAHPDTLNAMTQLAWVYGNMDRFEDSMELYEKFLALRTSKNHVEQDHPHALGLYAYVCLWAGKLDRAETLSRETLEYFETMPDSVQRRSLMGFASGRLAEVMLRRERYDEAEALARKAQGFDVPQYRRAFWMSVQGAAFLGQGKYAAAEPLLLQGYQGLKKWEGRHPVDKRRLAQIGAWIVGLYEATNQPEKARLWREKEKPHPSDSFLAPRK
jgi:non-specific serine/threonine protein kinase/serine/threonine-protein kinase